MVTVILTKSLDVMGTSFNTKMGGLVMNIQKAVENIRQMEGKIKGRIIGMLANCVRKQGS